MIYFIQAQAAGYIKIGWTSKDDADQRLAACQTGSPFRLVLLGSINGDYADERRWHERFVRARMSGEWFRPIPELLEHIRVELSKCGIECQPANYSHKNPARSAPLLSPSDAAAYLQIGVQTLANWRCVGRGPRYVHVGRLIRYRQEELDRWLEYACQEAVV